MASKAELASLIIDELLLGQQPDGIAEPFRPEHPFDASPQLPAGNGRWIPFSRTGQKHIDAFAKLVADNDPRIAKSFGKTDVAKIVGRAFGAAFAGVDIDLERFVIDEQVFAAACDELASALSPAQTTDDMILGCWALTGAGTEDIRIGPVRFVDRRLWLDEMAAGGRLSATSARRILARWDGRSIRPRKPTSDTVWERGTIDAVGDTDTVCVVTTAGLAHKVAEQKGLLAARIALTTLALHWQTPSKALERMGLLHDGPLYRRESIVFTGGGLFRTSTDSSGIKGHFITDEWREMRKTIDWLWGPVGEALTTYLQPSHSPVQPTVMNALFAALWWFHEASRERSPLIAIVKYFACLDALTGGNEDAGVRDLIKARLGFNPDDPLTKNGKTVKQAVREMYRARSLTIHGTNSLLGYDWVDSRGLAESIASHCLRSCCDWIHSNSTTDDLAALRR